MLLQLCQCLIERFTRAHGLGGFCCVWGVVAADVGCFALCGGKFGNDFRFVGG